MILILVLLKNQSSPNHHYTHHFVWSSPLEERHKWCPDPQKVAAAAPPPAGWDKKAHSFLCMPEMPPRRLETMVRSQLASKYGTSMSWQPFY